MQIYDNYGCEWSPTVTLGDRERMEHLTRHLGALPECCKVTRQPLKHFVLLATNSPLYIHFSITLEMYSYIFGLDSWYSINVGKVI